MAMEVSCGFTNSSGLDMDDCPMVGRSRDVQEQCAPLQLAEVGEMGQLQQTLYNP